MRRQNELSLCTVRRDVRSRCPSGVVVSDGVDDVVSDLILSQDCWFFLIFHTISIREIQADFQLKVLIRRSPRPCYIKGLGVGLDDVSPPLYSPGEVSFKL